MTESPTIIPSRPGAASGRTASSGTTADLPADAAASFAALLALLGVNGAVAAASRPGEAPPAEAAADGPVIARSDGPSAPVLLGGTTPIPATGPADPAGLSAEPAAAGAVRTSAAALPAAQPSPLGAATPPRLPDATDGAWPDAATRPAASTADPAVAGPVASPPDNAADQRVVQFVPTTPSPASGAGIAPDRDAVTGTAIPDQPPVDTTGDATGAAGSTDQPGADSGAPSGSARPTVTAASRAADMQPASGDLVRTTAPTITPATPTATPVAHDALRRVFEARDNEAPASPAPAAGAVAGGRAVAPARATTPAEPVTAVPSRAAASAPTDAVAEPGLPALGGPATVDSGPAQAADVPASTRLHPGEALVAQLTPRIVQASLAGLAQLSVRLEPSELGEVEIRLGMTPGGEVSVRLDARRPETLDLLQRHAPALERAVSEAGLRLDNAGLSFGQPQDRPAQQHAAFAARPADAEPARLPAAPVERRAPAATSRLLDVLA